MYWYPYTKRRGKLQERVVRLLGANGWRRKLGLRGRRGRVNDRSHKLL
jgi:hypothetical protein